MSLTSTLIKSIIDHALFRFPDCSAIMPEFLGGVKKKKPAHLRGKVDGQGVRSEIGADLEKGEYRMTG